MAVVWLPRLAVLLAPVVAGATPDPVIERLARKETVYCRPAIDVYCRNIHVSCSGRSTIPTAPFEARIRDGRARLEQDAGTPSAVDEARPVEWAEDRSSVIVRLRPAPGYLKILSDGTYSQRIYLRETAYMSYGRCE